MKIRGFDIGVESVSRWRRVDETHLPQDVDLKPTFAPAPSPLDEILRPATLDERLPLSSAPDTIRPELLHPHVMSETKERLLDRLRSRARGLDGRVSETHARAVRLMEDDLAMDAEVRAALVSLFRG